MNAEFLLKAVFNMLGLDAEATKVQLVNLQQWIIESIKKFDARLHVLESNHVAAREEMVAISQKLDAIIQYFGVNENERSRSTLIESSDNREPEFGVNGIGIDSGNADGQSDRDRFSH